jgi:hypothetical protein
VASRHTPGWREAWWAREVIWPQVTLGLGAAAVAALLWALAVRRMGRETSEAK